MNIGSLYKVKKWFWLLLPTKETAAATATNTATAAAAYWSCSNKSYWSKHYNCEVTYFYPDSYIVFLEEDGVFKKVLTSDGKIGWTWFDESYNDYFEEVKHP